MTDLFAELCMEPFEKFERADPANKRRTMGARTWKKGELLSDTEEVLIGCMTDTRDVSLCLLMITKSVAETLTLGRLCPLRRPMN